VAQQLEQTLAAAGIADDVKEYPEAGHSFLNNPGTCWFNALRVFQVPEWATTGRIQYSDAILPQHSAANLQRKLIKRSGNWRVRRKDTLTTHGFDFFVCRGG